MKKKKTILKVTNFDTEVRDALMEHCMETLGHRGANIYLQALIRKDLGLN